MKKYIISTVIVALSASVSCKKMLLDEGIENTPENNFEYIWSEYDRLYGLFEVKNLDWDSTYAVFRPQVNANTTEKELYEVLKSMLSILNDNHVGIIPTNPALPRYNSGILDQLGPQKDFYFELIKNHYLTDFKPYGENIHSGRLAGNIGYIHIAGFIDSKKNTENAIDAILSDLQDTKGIVLDIRDNGGGDDSHAQAVASRFAQQQTLYMTVRKRNGPAHTDFAPTVYWYVSPEDKAYHKPVVLLTSRYSVSAAETFSLAMKSIPTVTLVGDTTSGAFSDAIVREMPNGWQFTVSVGDFRAADGHSPEGIGVTPHVFIRNTKADIDGGHDLMLEKAMEILQ